MNWKKHFRYLVMERGRYYFNRGRVQGLVYKDNGYKAKVQGEDLYNVEIKMKGEEITNMKCSCLYAASGKTCKHMAAVLFAIEESGESLKKKAAVKKEKKVRPFQLSDREYQYFDMGRIAKDIEVADSVYKEAVAMLKEEKVVLQNVEVDRALTGTAHGYYKEGNQRRSLMLTFDRNHFLRGMCFAAGCGGNYRNVCKHLLALMMLAEEYLQKYNPGDTTDQSALQMIMSFRSQHTKEVIEQNTEQVFDLQFLPVLEQEAEGAYVSFKAGTDKLYVVKNLTDLMEKYEEQKEILFGTKTEIHLAKHRIAKESKDAFQYAQQIVKHELERIKHQYMNLNAYDMGVEFQAIKNKIGLFGERLDELYNLYEGAVLDCNDRSSGKLVKKKVFVREGKPEIRLRIEKHEDEEQIFHGIHVSGTLPLLMKGNRYEYFLTEDAFCRVDEETAKAIQPLLAMSTSGEINFSVGRKHLSEFYHQVLPILRECCVVEETEQDEILDYVPPKPNFAFHLDVEEGWIHCKAKAIYGEEVVSLLDGMRAENVFEAFRNRALEEDVVYQIQTIFDEVDLEKDEFAAEESEDTVLQLLEDGVARLMALGEVYTTERFRKMNVRKMPKISVGVSVKSDIMNLSISSEELDTEELLELLQNYKRKKKYYRLKNGDFVAVNEEDMETLVQMMESLQLSPKEFVKGKMHVPVYRALYLNKMLEQGEELYVNRDKNFKDLVKEFKTVDESEFEVPKSLSAIMRNYQVHGFKWMKTLEQYRFGGILADDMGLGKTLQMISVLLSAKEQGKEGTSLIVCPASLVYNWGEEFAKFAPELKVTLIVGNQQERAKLIQNYKECDVLVTSYDLLKRDIAEYEDAEFMYQVIDEAQYIKNHTTAVAKSVKLIKSKQRYALTGTPIENRLSELWSIFDYLMPGFLYRYDAFKKQLEKPIVKEKDEGVSEKLKRMVAPFILRRLKQDVLKDLPEKMEEIRYAKMESEQQQVYDAQVVHMQEMLAGASFEADKIAILAELTKIRQICCDPTLLFENYKGGAAKREACMELIQSAIEGEHKILVFSQFTSMLELLEADMNIQGISYYKITGATPKAERVRMVKEFNNDDTSVFLISLKAGGTGLNLTGADIVIHYDPWWNQAVQNQATDRAHRIGQKKTVSVFKLIAKDTIEEKIVKMQEEKKSLADAIISGETGGIGQMSKEDLMRLLEG